jgi:hypothetical protein
MARLLARDQLVNQRFSRPLPGGAVPCPEVWAEWRQNLRLEAKNLAVLLLKAGLSVARDTRRTVSIRPVWANL